MKLHLVVLAIFLFPAPRGSAQSFNEWTGLYEARQFFREGQTDSTAKRLILIAEYHSVIPLDSLTKYFPDSIEVFRYAIDRFRKRDKAMQRPFRPVLAALMDSIYKEDQKGRSIFDGLHNSDDPSNYHFVDSVLSIHGFMSESELGYDGAQAQFLVIQHSTRDQMEKWFPALTKAVDEGLLPLESYALMYDRIQVYRGKKQLYGTQIGPVDDPEGLAWRRILFGIL